MEFELVKIEELSGKKASIYTVVLDGEDDSLFDRFLSENSATFKSEILDILARLRAIANNTGAREGFFKTNEGKPGDGICALFDQPGSNLRLYCIRFGQELIILGGGGPKSKSIRAFQEDEKLEAENYRLREIAQQIMKALREKDIRFSRDFLDFEGDLIFEE